jgi:cell division protein FtsW
MLKETTDKLFSQMPSLGGVKEHLDQRTRGDKYIWALILVLSLISIMVVYSATGSLAYKMSKGNTSIYLFKQVAFTLMGLLVVFGLHRVNYTVFSRVATILFILSVPLLIYTLFFGAKINEGSRWIKLPIINLTIQSSDVAKLALFMYISRVLSKKQEVIKDFKKGFWPVFWPVLLICGLIMPANLSNALLTGATSLLLMFIGRVSFKHIGLVILVAMVPVVIIVSVAMATHKSNVSACRRQAGSCRKIKRFWKIWYLGK